MPIFQTVYLCKLMLSQMTRLDIKKIKPKRART